MRSRFKYKALVDQHYRLVYAIAYRILADRGEAEDASQEVYEKLWKHIDRIVESEAAAWLARVTKNLCIDKLRARKSHVDATEINELECHAQHTSDALQTEQLSRWLKDAIHQLDEPHKSLIYMIDIQQKSVRDAAESMGLNENQVKVYRHRARQTLKKLLRGYSP